MTSKHTAGGWVVDSDKLQNGTILIRDSEDWPIARVDCLKPSTPELDYEGEANARLIAAAPELKEACKLAYYHFGGIAVTEHTFTHVRTKLQQAIAKAEGKEVER